ncbi:hypothetical protein R6Q59_019544 [Mikania micrantha]
MIHAARGIFNRLLPDVHIFTDHKSGAQAGNSPGYGISLIAETTSGCFISVDTTISYPRENDDMDIDEKKELVPPEEVGEEIASLLLAEIEQGGVADSTHQGLLFLLLCIMPTRCIKGSCWKARTLRNSNTQKYQRFFGC